MSLFGSLYTGAAGMMAQSQATGLVSQNIANATTVGYKRSEAAFEEIVGGLGRFSSPTSGSGSVAITRILRAGQQGAIAQSSSSSDSAINGNGFFAVRSFDDPEARFVYTRNGSFSEDANGILRNSAGFILYGSQVTDQNTAPDVSNPDSLVPINVTAFDESAIPTSFLELSLNLDSRATNIDPHTFATPQQLPINTVSEASFVRSFGVVDGLGNPQNVRFEYRKTVGPMAHFTSNIPQSFNLDDNIVDAIGSTPGILNNDEFSITVGATTETFEFVDTAGTAMVGNTEILTYRDLTNAITNFGGGGILEANISETGQFLVQAIDPTASVELMEVTGTPLSSAAGLNIVPDPGSNDPAPDYIFEPEAILNADNAAYPNQTDFPDITNVTNPNVHNWWEVTIVVDDATTGLPNIITSGLINFDGTGSLNAASTNITPTNPIDFDGASAGEEISLTIDMTNITQFASPDSVIFSEQNGAQAGTRTGIEITREGYVLANFTNGQALRIFRIPLVSFNNVEGLQDLSGTIFSETGDSGIPTFSGAGEEGTGFIQSAALEQSAVDIAEEFSGLIVSQRAFSLNSQLIQAVNEMTQNLSQLKR